jgi:hypothetical protein
VTASQTFLVGVNSGPAPVAGKDCSPFFFSSSWRPSAAFLPTPARDQDAAGHAGD